MNRRHFLQTAAFAAAALPIVPGAFAASSSKVRLERDGMLRVRGKREFILGLYQVPKHDSTLREASEAGFNLINANGNATYVDDLEIIELS